MGLRSQIGWLRHGATRTQAMVGAYESELRELQAKVEALTQVAARLDITLARIDAEGQANAATIAHIETISTAMKEQLRAVTDDLGDRIGAVTERFERG